MLGSWSDQLYNFVDHATGSRRKACRPLGGNRPEKKRQQGTLVSLSARHGVSLESTLEVWCLHTRTLGQICTPCIGDWTWTAILEALE